MFSFLKKNKIIIAVFGSLFIISALFLTKIDFQSFTKKVLTPFGKKGVAFAQGISPYFFPRYSQRLMYLVDEVSLATEDLVGLNETLNNSIEKCNCQHAQSQCSSATTIFSCSIGTEKVFGDPCKNRGEINEEQKTIREKTQELTFLQELLKKEMETGFKRELESLDQETAEELKANLEKILKDSQEVISLAENNSSLPENCSVNKCSAKCATSGISELDFCAGIKGEQEPIEAKVKLSASLTDLDLGQVKIKNVNLGLPKEIEITRLGSLPSFRISGGEFLISIDKPQKSLRLQIPQLPSLPKPPSITLSCPEFPSLSTTYQIESTEGAEKSDLLLFTGEIEKPASLSYEGQGISASSKTIGNYPPSILGCPASLPTIPKICLPSVKLRDIKLPEIEYSIKISILKFKLKVKLLHIKLPNLIIEDINFPCIELCNINQCQDIFPNLNFQTPYFSIPRVEIPAIPLGIVGGVKLPDLELDSIPFPDIPFPFFRIPTLGNLTMPELTYSGFSLPSPKISFSFGGINWDVILKYLADLAKNAVGIPDFSLCINASLSLPIPIEVIFPDYYFSLCDLGDLIEGKAGKLIKTLCRLKVPEIPYCQAVNEFCENLKTRMAEVIDKAKKIEKVFNKFVQEEIQVKLDRTALEIQKELEKNIHQKLEELKAKIIRQVEEQISQGKKTIVIRIDDIEIPSLNLDALIQIPPKITIPWPEELEKIALTCDEEGYNQCRERVIDECNQECAQKKVNTRCNFDYLKCKLFCQAKNYSKKCDKEYLHCLSYDLPTIPLSCLGFSKKFVIKGPGLQAASFIFEKGRAECKGKSPSGGNPCPKTEFESNLGKIKNLKSEIEKTSQKIISILE